MENNENFVIETENVVTATEEPVVEPAKLFTQDDMNAAVGKAKARERAKIRKEYDRKYGELEEVLRTGTGKVNADADELKDTFRDFYASKGIPMPQKPNYSAKDIEVLANAEANEFINGGFEEVVEEVDRLAAIGIENMSARDKAVFTKLATYRQNEERSKALSKLGVTEDVYSSDDFKQFASKFNSNTPIEDVYSIYAKTLPKKEYKTMGSMKNNDSGDNGVKDFYTVEEARRFTKADYDKNPALYAAVEESMRKWK